MQDSLSEEIHVLSGGAARSFVEPAAAGFKAHSVRLEFQTMGKLVQTMTSAEAPRYDMLVATRDALDKLGYQGGTPLAKVGIGVAVNEKAPLPDISTPDALRRTLLAARSIVQINPATGTSGKFVEEMFKKLGIYDQVKGKTSFVDSGYAVAPVGRGEVELGIHQISEILPVKGAKLVGPLPPELQTYTVYIGVPARGTKHAEAVTQFMSHLTSAPVRASMEKAGYSAP